SSTNGCGLRFGTYTTTPIAVRCRSEMLLILSPLIVWRRRFEQEGGCDVSLYRSIANAVGTREGRDLAHRLNAWHDAMVIHRRRGGDAAGPSCDADCPHEEAESLWREA